MTFHTFGPTEEDDWLRSPVRGAAPITARFGETGPNWTNKHTGLDFAAVTGTPVVAVQSGIVMKAGWENDAYGDVVKVSHTVAEGSLETWYAHLSVVLIESGEHASRGEILGLVGSSGNTTGPHVHLEVRRNGTPEDPAQYLGVNVPPNPEGVGQQFGLNNPFDVDWGRVGVRLGMFVGGSGALLVGLYGARKAGMV